MVINLENNVRKVLLVADVPGWAFHHRAKDMMAMPTSKLKFTLKFRNQVTREDAEHYDLIYAISVRMAFSLYRMGIPLNKLAAGITSMRQFKQFMSKEDIFNDRFTVFFKGLRGVNTVTDEFVNKFSRYRYIHKTRVGIDENLFKPIPNRLDNTKFTVGWVGGRKSVQLKGYDIVTSAIKNLDLKLDIRSKTDNFVPREKMVEFYQGLDCFICSSSSEHIPLPILEAAACGVPIISTKVGIVPELIQSNKNGIIVQRNDSAIQKALQYLMDNPDKRKKMGHSVRNTILKHWTWEKCWKEWEEFFTTI